MMGLNEVLQGARMGNFADLRALLLGAGMVNPEEKMVLL